MPFFAIIVLKQANFSEPLNFMRKVTNLHAKLILSFSFFDNNKPSTLNGNLFPNKKTIQSLNTLMEVDSWVSSRFLKSNFFAYKCFFFRILKKF